MVSESCCSGCNQEFETVEEMLQHQFDSCTSLFSGSIVGIQNEQSNSENSSFSWNSSALLSPPSAGQEDHPQNSPTSFSSISSISLHTSSLTDDPDDSNVNVNLDPKSPSETAQSVLDLSHKSTSNEEVVNLIDIYSKYVKGKETEEEGDAENNDLFNDDMSAQDLLDSLVNLLQVMGTKLVEKDAEVLTLQADREYLRDENTKMKNKLMQKNLEKKVALVYK